MLRKRPGLRGALLALVLVGIAPVAISAALTNLDARGRAREALLDDAGQLVRLAALRHEDLLAAGEEVLSAIVRLPSVASMDPVRCSEEVAALLRGAPRFANLGVADAEGDMRCTGQSAATGDKLNFADRAWFQGAVKTRAFAVGDFQEGRITHRPSLVFGYPVIGSDGTVRGAAWANMELASIEEFAARARIPDGGVLTVVDRLGGVLVRLPGDDGWTGRNIADTPLGRRLAQDPTGTGELVGLDGTPRLYAFAPLGPTGGGRAVIAVGLPTSLATAGANAALVREFLALGVLLLVGLGLARWLAHRYVLAPTSKLVAVANRLAAGDRRARIGGPYVAGELGEVSRAFDATADALAAHEAELTLRRDQLRAILDNAPGSITLKGADGRYLLVNRRFEELTGVPEAHALGRTDHDILPRHAADIVAVHDAEVLASGASITKTTSFTCPDGDRTFETVVFPFTDDTGAAYGLCAFGVEVTEQVRATAERLALRTRLEQSHQLEGLGQLAGGIAHDFNNFLAVIMNYADFALGALPQDSDEATAQVRRDIDLISRTAEKAAAMTRQLLIFARKDTAQATVLDLNEVIAGLDPLLRTSAGEGIRFAIDLATPLWSTQADAGRLERVLVNLVVNARDAMPGGGTLRIRTGNVVLAEGDAGGAGLRPGAYVELAVTDTGTGMTPEVRRRACEPFFTTKQVGHGTGLGLATAFGIVADAGGRLSFESTPGSGTTVRVHLPAAATPGDEMHGAAGPGPGRGGLAEVGPEPHRAGGGATVLVVDDEPEVREAIRRVLSGHGYRVVTASDAGDALRACEGLDGDLALLITDVVMPGDSGLDLAEQARALCPGLPVLFVSGYSEDVLGQRLHPGPPVLTKPFAAEALLDRVRATLERGDASTPADFPIGKLLLT